LRLSADDPEQFARFYERHVDQILTFLYRRTACPETAADLTSETFAAAFLARRRFRDRGAPARAWLLGIAKHKLAKSTRRAKIERRATKRLGLEPPELDDASYSRIEELSDRAPYARSCERHWRGCPQHWPRPPICESGWSSLTQRSHVGWIVPKGPRASG
jgi:DNA-directed RNA polymerase specialized sigma24 family protein